MGALAPTVHIAYDDVTLGLIPADATLVCFYLDGRFKMARAKVQAQFPHAQLIAISCMAPGVEGADFYDCEAGDLTPAQLAAAVQREIDSGRRSATDNPPGGYASVSTWPAIVLELAKLGLTVAEIVIWTAHYTGVAHLCSPTTCRFPRFVWDAAGTQFTDRADNRSLDESLVTARWIRTDPNPPVEPHPSGVARFSGSVDLATGVWEVHGMPALGVEFAGPAGQMSAEIQVQRGHGGGQWRIQGIPLDSPPLGS